MHSFVFDVIGNRVPRKLDSKYRKDGEHVLVVDGTVGGKVVSLNSTSGEIFEMCDGVKTIEEIWKCQMEKYPEVDKDIIKEDTGRCIRDLEEMMLISVVQR